MAQEFSKGCEDCANFKNNETNFSYFGNKPIENLSNPIIENNSLDNSLYNKTDLQNDTTFLTNNHNNGNINIKNKNEELPISSLNNNKNNNDLKANLLINKKYEQIENEERYKHNSEDEEENEYNNLNNENEQNNLYNNKVNNNDNYNDNNIEINKNNNKDNSNSNNNDIIINNNILKEIDEDQERLNEIKRNYNSKIITKLFKDLMEKKKESHKEIYNEYSYISDNNKIDNNIRNELDVNLAPENNYLYIGNKYKNKKDGLGLELFSNTKAKYFGRFINDKRVFYGKFTINNDNYSYNYSGEIKGLYAYGFGWSENIKESIYYEGMWKNSKKEGYGIEKNTIDNSIYKGCFSNGKKNGFGQYIWSDGSNYKGEWLEGALHGYGIYHFQDGSIYTGSWENNSMNGFGEFTFPEIKTYLGYFEKDKRTGFGILIWLKEQKVFMGFWNENKQNGLGKFISSKQIRLGLWENGSLKEKILNEEDFINRLKGEETNYLNFFKLNEYEDILNKVQNILNF